MFKVLKVYIFVLFSLFFLKPVFAEDITITTYYPSPFGSYRELRASRMAIGDNYTDGTAFTWETVNGDGGEVDWLADLIVEGNMGIGTPNPGAKLHIVGTSQNTLAVDSPSYPEITYRVSGAIRAYNAIATAAGGYFTGSAVNDWVFRNEGGASTKFGRGATTDVTINNLGNVGIGTTDPSTYNLEVNGGIMFNKGLVYGNQWGALRKIVLGGAPYVEIQAGNGSLYGITIWLSSQRFKRDIKDLEIDSAKLYQLRPVSFNWKDDAKGKQRTFGLIAEEVEKVIPQLVSYDSEGLPHHVNYDLLAVLILNELKKIKAENDAQLGPDGKIAQEIKALKAENESLKSRIKEIEVKLK